MIAQSCFGFMFSFFIKSRGLLVLLGWCSLQASVSRVVMSWVAGFHRGYLWTGAEEGG